MDLCNGPPTQVESDSLTLTLVDGAFFASLRAFQRSARAGVPRIAMVCMYMYVCIYMYCILYACICMHVSVCMCLYACICMHASVCCIWAALTAITTTAGAAARPHRRRDARRTTSDAKGEAVFVCCVYYILVLRTILHTTYVPLATPKRAVSLCCMNYTTIPLYYYIHTTRDAQGEAVSYGVYTTYYVTYYTSDYKHTTATLNTGSIILMHALKTILHTIPHTILHTTHTHAPGAAATLGTSGGGQPALPHCDQLIRLRRGLLAPAEVRV